MIPHFNAVTFLHNFYFLGLFGIAELAGAAIDTLFATDAGVAAATAGTAADATAGLAAGAGLGAGADVTAGAAAADTTGTLAATGQQLTQADLTQMAQSAGLNPSTMTAADWTKLGVNGVTNLAGAGIHAAGATKAAGIQADYGNQALNLQKDIYNKNTALAQPWITAGTGTALPLLTAGVQPGGQFNKPYTLADFNAGPQAGLYDFANKQAQGAMSNKLAAGGGNMNTNAVQGAGQLASSLANQYYDTGFKENQATNSMALGATESLAGQSIAGGSAPAANAGTNLAQSGTGTLGGVGNVLAGGTVAGYNALSSLFTNTGNSISSTPNAMKELSSLFQ